MRDPVSVHEVGAVASQPSDTDVIPGLPPAVGWPRVVQTAAVLWFTERYVRRVMRVVDSPSTGHVIGLGRYVAVWEPEQIRELFRADPEVVRAGEANARVFGHVLPSSVLVLDGQRHVRMRRLISPPFHGDAVRRYGELISQLADEEVRRWPIGVPFAIQPRMQAIAIEVILRAVIGIRDPGRMARLRSLLPRVAQASILTYMAETDHPRLAESRLAGRLPWLHARHEADALLDEEIADHRADPDRREDVLALLMAARDEHGELLSDAELRDQISTLLIAGQETSATTLAWCFERLVRHPQVLARLVDEIDRDDGDAYLDAVINETLRVRPPVDGVSRRLSAPLALGGYLLPAGTIVVASIIGAGFSEAFADAHTFRPERLLDQPAPAFSLIPFGGGSRRCIGASFAVMEMKAILRAVLRHVELRTTTDRPERPVRTRRITTYPAKGGRVVVRSPRPVAQRQPAAA